MTPRELRANTYRPDERSAPPRGVVERLHPPSAGVALDLADVAKDFGEHSVLCQISLHVRPGEFLAIVGHSGCGKSTLLRLLAGLDFPSDGRIAIDGASVSGQVSAARMLFQDARLLPWRRVLENVGIGLKGDWRAAALEALRSVGLAERRGDWPSILSGGQRQRVALARALVARPKLLLLDEPLGALDALTRLEMQELLEKVWREQGCTAVLVTHDVAEAVSLADRVIVLEDGVVALEQTIAHARPRPRGNAELGAIEGAIIERLMRRGGRGAEQPAYATAR
jgi:sulfonate transport system ATP-binding protein